MGQLAKWCNTNNPLYWDGMDIARKISSCYSAAFSIGQS